MHNPFSPLQIFRYCPVCGKSGLSADSEKSLLCSHCGFRYYTNMSASVAAIIRNEKQEVLFTVRKFDPAAGLLDLPGGFVDLGETAENAVKREISEELNLTVVSTVFVGTFPNKYYFAGIEYQTLDIVFICTVHSLQGIHAADDVSGYSFRNPALVRSDEIGLESIRNVVQFLNKG